MRFALLGEVRCGLSGGGGRRFFSRHREHQSTGHRAPTLYRSLTNKAAPSLLPIDNIHVSSWSSESLCDVRVMKERPETSLCLRHCMDRYCLVLDVYSTLRRHQKHCAKMITFQREQAWTGQAGSSSSPSLQHTKTADTPEWAVRCNSHIGSVQSPQVISFSAQPGCT